MILLADLHISFISTTTLERPRLYKEKVFPTVSRKICLFIANFYDIINFVWESSIYKIILVSKVIVIDSVNILTEFLEFFIF